MKKYYSQEFKERAVRLSFDPDGGIKKVAAELKVGAATITRWRQELGMAAPRSTDAARKIRSENDQLRAELKQLEKEKKALAMEVEILKKAAAFFARNQA